MGKEETSFTVGLLQIGEVALVKQYQKTTTRPSTQSALPILDTCLKDSHSSPPVLGQPCSFLYDKIEFNLIYVHTCDCLYMCVRVCASVYGGQRRVSYCGTGVSGVCELPAVASGNWTLVLGKNNNGFSLLCLQLSLLWFSTTQKINLLCFPHVFNTVNVYTDVVKMNCQVLKKTSVAHVTSRQI